MPSFVIKCDREHDRYVYWSDIVEAPHLHGTRADIVQYLTHYDRGGERANIPFRMGRADETGTSALDQRHYGWDDKILIVEQRGMLRRANLWAFCEAYFGGPGRRDEWLDLLEPFDDCVEHGQPDGVNACPVLPCPDHVVNRG